MAEIISPIPANSVHVNSWLKISIDKITDAIGSMAAIIDISIGERYLEQLK